MNTIMSSLTVLFKKSRQSLMYCSIAALTMGVEEIVEEVVFNCPCQRHFAYGQAFLLGPAFLLFFPGILLDKTSWPRTGPRKSNVGKARSKLVLRYLKLLFATFHAMTRASIAPVAWLVLSFLQQKYYTCAYFGPPLADRISTNTNATDRCHFELGIRSKEMEERYKTRSQIAGWTLLLVFMLVLFTSVWIRRCVEKGRYLRIPSPEYYNHVEAKEALEQYHAIAKELKNERAKQGIHNLFEEVLSKDVDSRLKDVGALIQERYHQFFVIPPESPSYRSPQGTSDDYPTFYSLTQTGIFPVLVTDGSEEGSFEFHSSYVDVQLSSQINAASQNPRKLTRIILRQDSIDMS